MNWQAEDKYADIINLPHHASWKNVKIISNPLKTAHIQRSATSLDCNGQIGGLKA